MALIITLILVGLLLIAAEILLVPGVGVAGILGLMAMGGSCYYAFYEFDNTVGAIVTAVNALLIAALTFYVLRANTWKRMSLETSIDTKALDDDSQYVSLGEVGVAISRMAPMGTVRFGDKTFEAKILEGIVDPGTQVHVVLIEDGKVYVLPYFPEFSE
jgi:membrane-bound ClpP family serine protease